jgi:hypothetical protein
MDVVAGEIPRYAVSGQPTDSQRDDRVLFKPAELLTLWTSNKHNLASIIDAEKRKQDEAAAGDKVEGGSGHLTKHGQANHLFDPREVQLLLTVFDALGTHSSKEEHTDSQNGIESLQTQSSPMHNSTSSLPQSQSTGEGDVVNGKSSETFLTAESTSAVVEAIALSKGGWWRKPSKPANTANELVIFNEANTVPPNTSPSLARSSSSPQV